MNCKWTILFTNFNFISKHGLININKMRKCHWNTKGFSRDIEHNSTHKFWCKTILLAHALIYSSANDSLIMILQRKNVIYYLDSNKILKFLTLYHYIVFVIRLSYLLRAYLKLLGQISETKTPHCIFYKFYIYTYKFLEVQKYLNVCF